MAGALPPAIFLMGPTASGKTDLAVKLLQSLRCEIISVDSALIYKGMDIGTAKPEPELLQQAPHRLIDIIEPNEAYSVSRFRQDALQAMAEITAAGKIPLLVGGTMMYFKVLRDGIADLPPADEAVRQQILRDATEHGWAYVHDQLAAVDPQSAARIHVGDPQRLQRALEIYRITGRTMTELWQQSGENPAVDGDSSAEKQGSTGQAAECDYTEYDGVAGDIFPYSLVSLAVCPAERKELHRRIELRFRQMLEAGFVNEVKSLYESGKLDATMPSVKCVGYRQAWDYLEGKLDYDAMCERGIIATRQLAKRQLTWLRKWPHLHWLESDDPQILPKALKLIETVTN